MSTPVTLENFEFATNAAAQAAFVTNAPAAADICTGGTATAESNYEGFPLVLLLMIMQAPAGQMRFPIFRHGLNTI